tara:strand:+ start:8501 stop:9196 length:696 start_codon:yes stop_codon:yes gene_type:complete
MGGPDRINNILPLDSFVYLNKSLSLKSCKAEQCVSVDIKSSASGYIVAINEEGSFVMTAAHFCEDNVPYKEVKISSSFKAKRLDGERYDAKVLEYQSNIDACIMFVKKLTKNVVPVKISNDRPEVGDRVYNIAAPLGIYSPNMAPILEGRYSGEVKGFSVYSLPAAPGSSGSMILNSDGELVGMVQAVYIRFNIITLSIKYDDMITYIESALKRYMSYEEDIYPLISIDLN